MSDVIEKNIDVESAMPPSQNRTCYAPSVIFLPIGHRWL